MKYLITFLLVYLIIFIVLFIFEYVIKNIKDKLGSSKSFQVIVKKYDLSMNKSRAKKLSILIILINSLILSIPITLFIYWEINYILLLIISFIIFTILILGLYNLLGYLLKKKGW